MSVLAVEAVGYDPLRESRHPDARSAREQRDWLAWLELGNTASRTLYDYGWATDRALRMFPQRAYDEFTATDLAHIFTTFPAKSRRERVAAFRSWFKWGVKTRRLTANPLEELPDIPRRPQKAIDVFSDGEIELLTGLPDSNGVLFLILFDAMLRRSEARNLQVRHINLERGLLTVIEGKGGKDRLVPLTTRLTQALAEWFLLDGLGSFDYLWPIRPGGYELRRDRPMGNTSFTVWYRRCLFEAGVRYRNPHTTRHTGATRWLRRKGRLETLSRVMGHSSIRVTADLYAHLDVDDIAADLALVEGV